MWLFLIGASLGSLLVAVMHKLKAYIECRNHTVTGTTTEALGHNDLSKSKTEEALGHNDLRTSKTEALGHSDLNTFQTETSGHSDLIEAAPEVRGDRYEDNSTPAVQTPAVINSPGAEDKHDFDTEAALHCRRDYCPKYGNHDNFIPHDDFTENDLPEGYRDQRWLDYILAVAAVTLKVNVGYISEGRPNGFPFSNMRGSYRGRNGTGWVIRTFRKFTDLDESTCPCPQCRMLPEDSRRKQWGEFVVYTTHHVVFDHDEVMKTTCIIDYNKPWDREEDCPKLYGVRVEKVTPQFDVAYIVCVTHDEDVCLSMEEKYQRYYDMFHQRLQGNFACSQEYQRYYDPTSYTVCVSHPHGMSKLITVGEHRGVSGGLRSRWRYTTFTCPGSSGAPIIRLGAVEDVVFPGGISSHSRHRGRLINESNYDLYHQYFT